MTATHPHFFITRCGYCKAEKSRVARPDLTEDKFSDGICRPLCEPAKKAGWAQHVKKEDGGDL